MLDLQNLLKVAEAVAAVEKANDRVSAGQSKLEVARATAETIRAEIAEAKESVSSAKSDLDGVISLFNSTGLTKAAILSAAEDMNRVFSGLASALPASDEAEVEPDVKPLTLKKLADSVEARFAAAHALLAEEDARILTAEELIALTNDVLALISGGATAAKAATKDDGAGKRKRRGKTDQVEIPAVDADAATVSSEAEPAGDISPADVAAEVEPVVTDATLDASSVELTVEENKEAFVALTDTAPVADDSELLATFHTNTIVETAEEEAEAQVIVVEGMIIAESVAVEEPAAEAVAPAQATVEDEIDNREVRDEVLALIAEFVEAPDYNNIILTTALVVFAKAKAENQALNIEGFIAALTADIILEAANAGFADDLTLEVDQLASDIGYVRDVLDWFRNGLAAVEAGKDFPDFEAHDETTPVSDDETLTAVVSDTDGTEAEEALEAIEATPAMLAAEEVVVEPAAPIQAPAVEPAAAPVAAPVATPAPEKGPTLRPPGFMKPGFMKG